MPNDERSSDEIPLKPVAGVGQSADDVRLKVTRSAMVKALYRYIWKISARDQILLSLMSVGVFVLELVPLELQRRIVNTAVHHQNFHLIIKLCLIYLAVALVHGGLKLGTNIYKGSVSEATNKDLRLKMEPVMTSGLESGRSIGDRGVRISMIVSEVEAVGGFAGTSFSDPILNAGVLLSVFGYMLYVQPWMAAIALVMFLPQLLVIPTLQEAINQRTEQRIQTLRALSSDILHEASDPAARPHRGKFRRRIAFVYVLNVQIVVRKYGINFVMNLLYTLGLIGILGVGGWMVLNGRTEVGTIVAFISGVNRMNTPWRDLMTWLREVTNAGTKYGLIVEQLDSAAVTRG
jgi:ABC-type multidrug transport system fused ATPase/permease subunit